MTVWLVSVLVVVVLGAVAVVAAGAGGTLGEPGRDRPPSGVPDSDPLSADDLRRVRFPVALRGYRMADVDALLERVAEQWESGPSGGADSETR